jgi:pyruvate/2-oxoglutarate dehydrogenase complex dihydrolipoamide acyltransferase (E2) component
MKLTRVARRDLSPWRDLAPHMWRRPDYPVAYGLMDIDVRDALAAIGELRASADAPVTINHLVIKACANALVAVPEANCLVMRWGVYRRPTIDIFALVDLEDGRDLMGVTLREVDRMSVLDIARTLHEEAEKLRGMRGARPQDPRRALRSVPRFLRRSLMRLTDFVIHELGIEPSGMGASRNQFGGVSVSFLGSYSDGGPLAGLPPLMMPIGRVAVAISVGRAFPRPVAIGRRVEIRPVMPVGASVDHRLLDGAQVSRLASTFRATLERPWDAVRTASASPLADVS